jgi:hypothetical protein
VSTSESASEVRSGNRRFASENCTKIFHKKLRPEPSLYLRPISYDLKDSLEIRFGVVADAAI